MGDDYRTEGRRETLSSRPERQPPAWAARLRDWSRTRPGRAVGIVAAGAVVAAVALADLDRAAPGPTPTSAPLPGGDGSDTGPVVELSPVVDRLWPAPQWYATEEVVSGLDGESFDTGDAKAVPRLLSASAPGGTTGSALSVKALHASVVVEGVRIERLDCKEPSAGSILVTAQWSGSLDSPLFALSFDLDSPAAAPVNLTPSGGGPYTPITLTRFQSRRIEVLFSTRSQRCSFSANLLLSSGGRDYAVGIPRSWSAEGKPLYGFEVTAPGSGYKRVYSLTDDGYRSSIASRRPNELQLSGATVFLPFEP